VACYLLVLLAGVARVAVPLLWPAASLAALEASALFWSAGFGLYGAPTGRCQRARLDGKPG
jgi:uncharacterized protein involved in response to NO